MVIMLMVKMTMIKVVHGGDDDGGGSDLDNVRFGKDDHNDDDDDDVFYIKSAFTTIATILPKYKLLNCYSVRGRCGQMPHRKFFILSQLALES